jgi:flagellar hook-associated protein 2
MAINFGGLSSGLDTESIITELVKIERAPIAQIASKQSQITSARDSLSSFLSKLTALRKAADDLATPAQFNAFKATSSDGAVVASVTGSASAGSYDVVVDKLAREQRNHSNTFGSATAALGQAGDLQIKVGAANAVTVTVTAADSLSAVAGKINASGARVAASVLYDGANYRLQVRGLDSGADNAVTYTDNGTALGLDAPGSVIQTARNARVFVDGLTVERPTNQVTGVIPGVTLALTKEQATPVTVSVDADPSALKAKIQSFASAYNDVMAAARLTAGFGTIKAGNALLSGDGTVRDAVSRVSRALGAPVAGATGLYRSLGSVGLVSQRDGSLTFNASKFDAAVLDDAAGVQKLFVVDAATGANGAMGTMRTALTALTTGEKAGLNARIAAFGKELARLDDRSERLERQASEAEASLRKRFTAMEQAVARYKAQGDALGGITSK